MLENLTEAERKRFTAYLRERADVLDVMAHEMEKIGEDDDPNRPILAKRMRKVARANRTTAENLPF